MTERTAVSAAAPTREEARELGQFLRHRRESIDPARLGLARHGRRRTPGLRREDVAALADIGVTWYTKLEQGQPIRVSPRVLAAVARALQCSDSETRHLFTLARLAHPDGAPTVRCEQVSPMALRILHELEPLPALLQNARYDILAYNDAYCRMVNVDLGRIAAQDRNCIYLALTHPDWRASLAHWDEMLPRMVAQFRSAMAEHRNDPVWIAQLERYMQISPEFVDAWRRYEVRAVENQLKRFVHPQLGVFALQQMNWWSAAAGGNRLLVYVPVDAAGEAALGCAGPGDTQASTSMPVGDAAGWAASPAAATAGADAN
jgi:transcriptional regulator with XRE-family HTH domain